MKLFSFIIIISLAAATNGTNYELDSRLHCLSYARSYVITDSEAAHVYIGSAHYGSKSTKDRCALKLYSERGYSYSLRKLRIEVERAVFYNNDIKVKILDGSDSYARTLKVLRKNSYGSTVIYTTQPYVYIEVDRSACYVYSTNCKNGLDVHLKITNFNDDVGRLSDGAIVGIVFSVLVTLGLLIGVPVCVYRCRAATSFSTSRQEANVATVTTTAAYHNYPGTATYPQQQYVVQGGNVSVYQPQPLFNMQAYQANAPPAYEVVDQYPLQQFAFAAEAKDTPAAA